MVHAFIILPYRTLLNSSLSTGHSLSGATYLFHSVMFFYVRYVLGVKWFENLQVSIQGVNLIFLLLVLMSILIEIKCVIRIV